MTITGYAVLEVADLIKHDAIFVHEGNIILAFIIVEKIKDHFQK